MDENIDLDLSALTMTLSLEPGSLKARFKESMAEQEQYKQEFGDGWWEKYCRDKGWMDDCDLFRKAMDEAIYEGLRFYEDRRGQNERMKALFGDEYEVLKDRGPRDPHVAELLITDAVKTGRWKELPDGLQAEYHRRVGDIT